MSWFTRVYRLAHAAMQSGSNVKEWRSINPLKLLSLHFRHICVQLRFYRSHITHFTRINSHHCLCVLFNFKPTQRQKYLTLHFVILFYHSQVKAASWIKGFFEYKKALISRATKAQSPSATYENPPPCISSTLRTVRAGQAEWANLTWRWALGLCDWMWQ